MHLEHQSLKSIFYSYTKHLSEDSRKPQYAGLLNRCHSSSLIYFLDVFYHPFLSVLVLLLLLLFIIFFIIIFIIIIIFHSQKRKVLFGSGPRPVA